MNALAAFALALLLGCAGVKPGNDPVVVHAEQTIAIAFSTCDAFVCYEHVNNADGQLGQDVRLAAERIRKYAPQWIEGAQSILRAYKASRADENRANLITALATLETAMTTANQYLARK